MESNKEGSDLKRGYLTGDYEYFHIKDRKKVEIEFHYHDFNKIIIFIAGNVTYNIEGKAYKLKPWDILLISSRQVHYPVIDTEQYYERIILWINQGFLDKHSSSDCNLSSCFELALKTSYNLLRFNPELVKNSRNILSSMEEAQKSRQFGSRILKNALFMQLLVMINREFLGSHSLGDASDIEHDERIDKILGFINGNLGEELSVETISEKFYISKYHLMHKFKTQTGYTLHNYILLKRLISANNLLKSGKPALEVSIECGFGDYSNFVRSFKKMFGASPKNHYKNLLRLEEESKETGHMTDNIIQGE